MNDTINNEWILTGEMSNQNEEKVFKDTTPKKLVGIYGLLCLITNKWYIGETHDIYYRWNQYKFGHCKRQPKLFAALNKYGYNNFEKRVIELCDSNISQEMLDLKEIAWIKFYRSYEDGYNLTEGGSRGKHSNESKQKISNANRKRIYTEETRKKLSSSLKGKNTYKRSEETKNKMKEAHKIRRLTPISQETRMKLSKSLTGRIGRKWNEEDRKKLSVLLKGKSKSPRTIEHINKWRESIKKSRSIKKSLGVEYKHSDESKKKMSQYRKKWMTEENKNKLREKMIGKKLSEEHKIKIGIGVRLKLLEKKNTTPVPILPSSPIVSNQEPSQESV